MEPFKKSLLLKLAHLVSKTSSTTASFSRILSLCFKHMLNGLGLFVEYIAVLLVIIFLNLSNFFSE